MVTHWRSDPITTEMEAPSMATRTSPPRRVNNMHRPQIYVHVEFGVSWSQRHLPNNHEVTYRSKGLRKAANFPRQVPPLNTNYLEPAPVPADAIQYYYQDQEGQRGGSEHGGQSYDQFYQMYQQQNQQQLYEQQQQLHETLQQIQQHHQDPDQLQTPPRTPPRDTGNTTFISLSSLPSSQPPPPPAVQEQEPQQPNQRHVRHSSGGRQRFQPQLVSPQEESNESDSLRTGRDGRMATQERHERGHSAPPPINDSPWDVTQMMMALPPDVGSNYSPGPSGALLSIPPVGERPFHLMKNLPEPPTSYRLGEEGMPWDALSWPMGYEPDADPEHAASASDFQSSYYPGERRLPPTLPGGYQLATRDSVATDVTYVPYSPMAHGHANQMPSPDTPAYHMRRVPTAPAATLAPTSHPMQAPFTTSAPVLPRVAISSAPSSTPSPPIAIRGRANTAPEAEGGRMQQLQPDEPVANNKRDLSALSIAMMTVDNGFENQWWNQGERASMSATLFAEPAPTATAPIPPVDTPVETPVEAMTMATIPPVDIGDPFTVSPTTMTGPQIAALLQEAQQRQQREREQRRSLRQSQQQQQQPQQRPHQHRDVHHESHTSGVTSLGWAIATPSQQPHYPRHPSVASTAFTSSVVSPITPGPTFAFLGRSLSTRSEEAYLTGGRYA